MCLFVWLCGCVCARLRVWLRELLNVCVCVLCVYVVVDVCALLLVLMRDVRVIRVYVCVRHLRVWCVCCL